MHLIALCALLLFGWCVLAVAVGLFVGRLCRNAEATLPVVRRIPPLGRLAILEPAGVHAGVEGGSVRS